MRLKKKKNCLKNMHFNFTFLHKMFIRTNMQSALKLRIIQKYAFEIFDMFFVIS
jgi:hypothetical protein